MLRIPAWLPALAWAAAIIVGSFLPSKNIPDAAMGRDVALHALLYAGQSLLTYRWRPDMRFVLLACVAFASIQEPLQGLSPTREASLSDWLSNLVGIALASLVLAVYHRRHRHHDSVTDFHAPL